MIIGQGCLPRVIEVAQIVVNSILRDLGLISAAAPVPGYAFEGEVVGLPLKV
jgi:hypothetical protein